MNSKPGQPMRGNAGKHPMRAAGEFFGWLWGPSEAERNRRRGIAGNTTGQRSIQAPSIQAPLRHQQVVEQRIEDGRIVLRRITIEEIEIQREIPRGQSQG